MGRHTGYTAGDCLDGKKLIFNNTSLAIISRELANYFNAVVEITDPALGKGIFTWNKQNNTYILQHK